MLKFKGKVQSLSAVTVGVDGKGVAVFIQGDSFSFSTNLELDEAPRVGDVFEFVMTKEPSLSAVHSEPR